jgi:hypothetical protein
MQREISPATPRWWEAVHLTVGAEKVGKWGGGGLGGIGAWRIEVGWWVTSVLFTNPGAGHSFAQVDHSCLRRAARSKTSHASQQVSEVQMDPYQPHRLPVVVSAATGVVTR